MNAPLDLQLADLADDLWLTADRSKVRAYVLHQPIGFWFDLAYLHGLDITEADATLAQERIRIRQEQS